MNKKITIGIGILITILLVANIANAYLGESTFNKIKNTFSKKTGEGQQLYQTINNKYNALTTTIGETNKLSPPKIGQDHTSFYQQKSKKLGEIMTLCDSLITSIGGRKDVETYNTIYSETQKVKEDANNALQYVNAFATDDEKDGTKDGKIALSNKEYADKEIRTPSKAILTGKEKLPDAVVKQEKEAKETKTSERAWYDFSGKYADAKKAGEEKAKNMIIEALKSIAYGIWDKFKVYIVIGVAVVLWLLFRNKKGQDKDKKTEETKQTGKFLSGIWTYLVETYNALKVMVTKEVETPKDVAEWGETINWVRKKYYLVREKYKVFKNARKKTQGETKEGKNEILSPETDKNGKISPESLEKYFIYLNQLEQAKKLTKEEVRKIKDHYIHNDQTMTYVEERKQKQTQESKPASKIEIVGGKKLKGEEPKGEFEDLFEEKPKGEFEDLFD